MDFRILGPLEVTHHGRELALADGKQRALLAVLLLRPNEVVSTDLLIQALWSDRPPASAAKGLRVYVSRLRRSLETNQNGVDPVIVSRAGGYLVRVAPGELDRERFENLVEQGTSALADGLAERAAELLGDALGLWRGPPLAEFAYESFAQIEIARLEELQLAALEQRIEAALALGQHATLVGELEALVDRHPLRERPRAQLMLALYRCGRQSEALKTYRQARQTLVDQLGLEPGEELRQLERRILAQDADLDAPTPARPSTGRLPLPPTRTIGREGDLEAVSQLFANHGVRLVTLTGPGGVGKTRLAMELARRLGSELRDGTWFVSLAATARVDQVPSAIVQALGVAVLPSETQSQAAARFLAPKHALLVLDNFEHVLAAYPRVRDLLDASEGLLVLVTSREPLRLEAEHRYAVEPLASAPAGALFVDRARSLDRHFELTDSNAEAVAEICSRLDGLPLAIELAAARTPLFEPSELAARLVHAVDALGTGARDAPDRQRTLRATLDWSYRLLSAAEAEALGRFAVFAGGATVDSAEQVTGAELEALEGLVEKHLLARRAGRLLMLGTVREYASQRLDADPQAAEVHERHCRHYLALVERAEPELFTHGEAEWLPRLEAEIDNLRAAFDWSLHHGEPALALRIAGLLDMFWEISGRNAEGLEWVDAALDRVNADAVPIEDQARALRARVHLDEATLFATGAAFEHARARAADALALSRRTGDPAAVADALVGLAALEMGKTFPQPRRRALAEEALAHAREADDARLIAFALMHCALARPPEQSEPELERAAEALHALGATRIVIWLYSNAAYGALKTGQPELARSLLDRATPLAREAGTPSTLAYVCGNAGLVALFNGELERASEAFNEQLQLCQEHVLPLVAAEGLAGLAAVVSRRGDLDHAARLLGAAAARGLIADADVAAQLEEQFFGPARGAYGEERWSKEEAEGARLSFEQAITLALSPDHS